MIKFHKRTRMSYWCHWKIVEYLDRNNPRQKTRKKLYTTEEVKQRLSMRKGFYESVANKLQDIVMFPLDLIYSVKIHFKNLKGNTHVLDGGLEKGTWYDLCYRIPRCLFYELEKFIEQEKGLETHEWEKTLTHNDNWVSKDDPKYGTLTNQALAAIEQQEIYDWWKANKDREYTTWEDEEKYDEKEQEMLIRLVKIYRSLWT